MILNYLVLPAFESIKGISRQNAQLATAGVGIFGEMEASIAGGILAVTLAATVIGCCVAGVTYCCSSAGNSARVPNSANQLDDATVDAVRRMETGGNTITIGGNQA